jgi:hypothetical protein
MATSESSLTDKVIAGLKKAVVEIEEFRVQAALGKAEARDVFEASKKKLNKYVQEAHIRLESAKSTTRKKTDDLRAILETLQVQLALGIADGKEEFEKQRKKIARTLKELETLLEESKITDEYYTVLRMEAKKFKIKLDIVKLRYELNKLNAKEEFEDRKKEFSKKLAAMKKTLLEKEKSAEITWEHFSEDVADAYSHLKKTFVR